MAYTPPKIEDVGLLGWLTQRGVDYQRFVNYADDYIAGIISLAALARKMDIDDRTASRWVDVYKKEQNRG